MTSPTSSSNTRTAIYLDHNATTPLNRQALDAMQPYLLDRYGNSLSGHQFGFAAATALDEARAQVAALIAASPEDIVFTSGGSEAINYAIKGLALANLTGIRKRLLFGATEHHAVEDSIQWLERFGFEGIRLPVDHDGRVLPATLRAALQQGDTLLVAIMWANNEVGTIQPVEALSALCRDAGVPFLCDAVQAVGKIPINSEMADLIPLAAHKFYGPKGYGALYIRRGLPLDPLIHGAQHEWGRRAGTSPVALAVGMGQAAKIVGSRMEDERRRLSVMRDQLELSILATIPDSVIHGKNVSRLSNTSCVSFRGVSAWQLQQELDKRNIAVSAGAACRSGIAKPSATLLAMGVEHELALGGVRISFGHQNTLLENQAIVDHLGDAVEHLRHNS